MGAKFRVGRSESQTLKNLVRSYNREVIKMEAKLPTQVHLPPSVDYADINLASTTSGITFERSTG